MSSFLLAQELQHLRAVGLVFLFVLLEVNAANKETERKRETIKEDKARKECNLVVNTLFYCIL